MDKKATMILISNNIFTALEKEPVPGAVIITDNKITAVTEKEEARAYIGKDTEVYELDNQLVCPGFVDNHVFFTGYVWSHIGADLSGAVSKKEAAEILKAYADTIPEDRSVLGHGLPAAVAESEEDTIEVFASLNGRATIGFTADRDGCIMNEAAKEKFGFDGSEVYAEICWKVFDEFLRDEEFIKAEYEKFSVLLAKQGITAIKEIGFDRYSGFTEILKKLEEKRELKHRVNLVSQPVGYEMDYEYAQMCREKFKDEFVQFMGYNVMVDGEIASHNADVIDEYKNFPGSHGEQEVDYGGLEKQVLKADALGFRCALHAEGDRAVRKTIDIYEKCCEVNGTRDSRHIITDLEMVRTEDLERMAALGITACNYVQIMDCLGDYEDFYGYDNVGEEGIKNYWPYKRMFDCGVHVACGTDLPLTIPDIPLSAYLVVNRTFPSGEPAEGINKECALTVDRILKAWTKEGQYANFKEHVLGTLEAGKLADIAVIDKNLFAMKQEKLKEAKVSMTICDGKIVYKKELKVAAIGDNCIDLYENLDRFYATGNAVDFAVNMKKLGVDTAVISTTGNDEYGKIMIDTLLEQGIDISHFKVAEGKTAVSYMDLVGLDRTYLEYEEGVMENVVFTQEDIDFAASCDLVHSAFWGNAHMHLKEIHEKGAKICFDYATEWKDPMVEETIAYVDYPFFSFEHRTEETDNFLKSMVEKGASIAVGTFGEEGSVAYDGNEFYTCGIQKAELVNTIGAGDSYMAGFMNGVIKGWDIPKCQEQGAKVAAGVVSVFGPWEN